MILDAWGWCTGTTQRDGMGREEGGGFRMGNTCIPVADYVKFKNKIKFKKKDITAAFSSYDGDLSLPLGLALGSPIFPSGCEGTLGVALESG